MKQAGESQDGRVTFPQSQAGRARALACGLTVLWWTVEDQSCRQDPAPNTVESKGEDGRNGNRTGRCSAVTSRDIRVRPGLQCPQGAY